MGGKSRKSGGVSKKLIDQIKNGGLKGNKACQSSIKKSSHKKLIPDEEKDDPQKFYEED